MAAHSCPNGRDRRYKTRIKCRKAPKRRARRIARSKYGPAAAQGLEGTRRRRRRRR
jgi:hypothetical protein